MLVMVVMHPVIPIFRRQREEDYEFKPSPCYIIRFLSQKVKMIHCTRVSYMDIFY